MVCWWSLQGFLCIASGHLQTVTGFLLSSSSDAFCCLSAVSSDTVLNRSGEKESFRIFTIDVMLAVSLSQMAFIMLRYIPSTAILLRVCFALLITNGY